jgi:hypothetical protein
MKLAIVGSRSITDRSAVEQAIQESPWCEPRGMTPPSEWNVSLVSGGADGVDTSAELIARDWDLSIEEIEPNYSDWIGEHPAKRRNTEIVEAADAVVAVWDGHSNGTRDTIDKALDRGVPLYVKVIE